MPAAIPILVAVTAATATYGAVNANQQAQHAKGAAQAEAQTMNDQVAGAQATDLANKKKMADASSGTRDAAIAALKASMTASGGGTIGSPSGVAPAPTATKTLLGV